MYLVLAEILRGIYNISLMLKAHGNSGEEKLPLKDKEHLRQDQILTERADGKAGREKNIKYAAS